MMLRLRAGKLIVAGGSRLLGGRIRSKDSFFIFDCGDLEKRLPAEGRQDTPTIASDKILAAAFSSSGDYFALTDDSKRLVLFRTTPTWEKISIRWVCRRCTSLTFSPCERRILVADKSGDVFSFSVQAAQEEGHLELGHLSMLLDLVVTQDGQYIITCDRDEKIRVSQRGAPHVITAFCLGHTEFVSQLASAQEKLLLSGSGDGTLRLWRYETGQELQRFTIGSIERPEDSQNDTREIKRFAVSRICCSGEQVAVLCDGIPGIYLFSISTSPHLTHQQYVALPYVPVDMDFEDLTSLWVLLSVKENPIALLQYREQRWQLVPLDDRMKEVSETIRKNWEQMEGSVTLENRFSALYKAVVDNMASYLQKKEARIQTEKRKSSTGQTGAAAKIQKM
ncbi:tRNA (guanine-N(7)-)-methyltransferase non-catalytic subunit WDR4 isoform X1 [Bufo gargarizans]|uniref:tRNA (guanine-N(7)-)-methyltransferase non-catalytic subunit WDR4 isoform X1 n=1 Tax=Bufo gargarizans TaxID=30331 RepID=UPI001CF41754|nr:tRNA (guanine-N(7)-)-methyltransferase non-catalytic subunit WDR4 isoform X1 [Bufo gargarizans]